MEHPKLPGQPIYVRPGALDAYRRAGWREAAEPEPVEQEQEQPRTSRRRRVSTQEDDNGTVAA